MARQTAEQDKYYRGMKLLIDLYYSYKSLGKKSDISQEFIEKYIQIFRLLLPGFNSFVCIKRKKLVTFIFNRGDGLNVECPSETIISYFDLLREEFKSEASDQFKSIELLGETVRSSKGDKNKSLNKIYELYFQEEYQKDKGSLHIKEYRLEAHSKITFDKLPKNKILRPDQVTQWCNVIDNQVYYPAYKHQTYEVQVASSFGRKIVDYGKTFHRYRSILTGIPYLHAPGYDKIVKLYEFLNGVFFGFYVAFGSFKRIKLCKNKSCEKLFVEKRLGSKEFCCDICRKKHYDSLQDPAKRLCREKQNAWIRIKLSPVFTKRRPILQSLPEYHVFKDDCDLCVNPVKGGLCKKLEDKYGDKHKKIFMTLRS